MALCACSPVCIDKSDDKDEQGIASIVKQLLTLYILKHIHSVSHLRLC